MLAAVLGHCQWLPLSVPTRLRLQAPAEGTLVTYQLPGCDLSKIRGCGPQRLLCESDTVTLHVGSIMGPE